MSEISERIKVYLRLKGGSNDAYELSENDSGIVDTSITHQTCLYHNKSTSSNQIFHADSIFKSDTIQEEVYNEVAKSMISSVQQGYSAAILAYGPTGSGKTFTMRGESGQRGIIPRCVEDLLQFKQANDGVELWASYYQIYCETITDLLIAQESTTITTNDAESLVIKSKPDNSGVYIDGLSKYLINNVDDIMELLQRGDSNRTTAATNCNDFSSRSHAILTLSIIIPIGDTISSKSNNNTTSSSYKEGKLVLVDLAGSERATASEGRSYMRLEEAKAINLSLSSLGNCISALAEGRTHVPYRDSKLTRLLQDSISGQSRVSIVVTLYPGIDTHGETLSALRFATRASQVKVSAKVKIIKDYEVLYKEAMQKIKLFESNGPITSNNDSKGKNNDSKELIMKLQIKDDEIEKQQQEIEQYKEQLLVLQNQNKILNVNSTNTNTNNNSSVNEEKWKQLIDQMNKEFQEKIDMANKLHTAKLNKLKKEFEQCQMELSDCRLDIITEREKHLQTVQDLRRTMENKQSMEQEYQARLADLLNETNTLRNQLEEVQETNQSKCEVLQQEKEVLMIQMKTMVSTDQVKEMETLFMDAIQRLSSRVKALEGSQQQLESFDDDIDDDEHVVNKVQSNNASNWMQTSNKPVVSQGAVSNTRNVKIEPGGRIRSGNNTTVTNNNSNQHNSSNGNNSTLAMKKATISFSSSTPTL